MAKPGWNTGFMTSSPDSSRVTPIRAQCRGWVQSELGHTFDVPCPTETGSGAVQALLSLEIGRVHTPTQYLATQELSSPVCRKIQEANVQAV